MKSETSITQNNVLAEEEIIRSQLNRLDKQKSSITFIGALISLIATFGLGAVLKILSYWIPASVALFFLWSLVSFPKLRKQNLTESQAKKSIDMSKAFNLTTWEYASDLFVKSLSPLMKAVAIIYSLNILIILLHFSKIIMLPFNDISIYIIILVFSISFVISIFTLDKFPRYFSRQVIPTMRKVPMVQKNTKLPHLVRRYLVKIIVMSAIVFLIVATIGFPLWVFIMLLSYIENWFFLIVIIIMQFIVLILFSSSFSLFQVKSELEKSLNDVERIKINELDKELLLRAVRFSRYIIADWFKFLHCFLIVTHPKYLEKLKAEQDNGN